MDMKVVQVCEGTGKYEGFVGAIKCIADTSDGKHIEVYVGSGLSDEQRFEWAKNENDIIGKIVEIGYFEVSQNSGQRGTNNYSYSYGIGDSWGTSENAYSPMLTQYQGTKNNYWNIGASLSLPLEDILDLTASVKRKKMEVDQAVLNKDIAFDQLKLQIATLFVQITNNLITLKTLGESAAAYQGAGALDREDFENGNMEISSFAATKMRESSQVSGYQNLQTEITTDILTLEILTHTPIITNATTEITLDKSIHKTPKEQAKENKANEKRIKRS